MILPTRSMQMSRPVLFFIPVVLISALLTLYTWQSHLDVFSHFRPTRATSDLWQTNASQALPPNPGLAGINNRTLGFQEIRVISLSERTDKHDAWAVTASLAGFDYELADGVDADSISPKALPYTMDQKPKIVACWRAHLDVLTDIVNRGVATTLIFEDDADWDVGLRSQLVQFARGSQWLLNATSPDSTTPTREFDSPYGPDWDLLWLGHCGAKPDPWDARRFVIPNDPTVEPAAFRQYGQSPEMYHWENPSTLQMQTRLVVSIHHGVCTAGYAISLEGARKALYHMSMLPYDGPVDWGYGDLCNEKKSGFTCIAPYPPIVGTHRAAGKVSGWSDIEGGDSDEEISVSFSERVVYSYRMNLDRLLRGERMMAAAHQTATMTGVEWMDIDEIGSAVGHEEVLEQIGEKDSEYR